MLRIATRASALARWQAEHVAGLLQALDPDLEVDYVIAETHADRRLDLSIAQLGGKGAFVKEIQAALLDGRADIAVHSAKDLPTTAVPDLVLAAVPERGDARDALVGSTLAELGPGAHIGTGSARRRVQLIEQRPDLEFSGLRGNMARRLEQLVDFDAIVVAAVALERLGFADRLTEVLETSTMTPQVAQGALAVECRRDDPDLFARLAAIEHAPSRRRIDAERAFLRELGGDCTLPAGAHATIGPDGTMTVTGLIASGDGSVVLRHRVTAGPGARDVAIAGADLARYLLDHGGEALLEGA